MGRFSSSIAGAAEERRRPEIMVLFVADENFNGHISRAVQRQLAAFSFVRAQDVGLSGKDDSAVLEWAADHARIVVTHDASTMVRFAYERVAASLSMPGLLEVRQTLAVSPVVQDI